MLVSSNRLITKYRVELDERDVKRALIEYIGRNPHGEHLELSRDAEHVFIAGGSSPFTITETTEQSRWGDPGATERVVVVEFTSLPLPELPVPPSVLATPEPSAELLPEDDDLPF